MGLVRETRAAIDRVELLWGFVGIEKKSQQHSKNKDLRAS